MLGSSLKFRLKPSDSSMIPSSRALYILPAQVCNINQYAQQPLRSAHNIPLRPSGTCLCPIAGALGARRRARPLPALQCARHSSCHSTQIERRSKVEKVFSGSDFTAARLKLHFASEALLEEIVQSSTKPQVSWVTCVSIAEKRGTLKVTKRQKGENHQQQPCPSMPPKA